MFFFLNWLTQVVLDKGQVDGSFLVNFLLWFHVVNQDGYHQLLSEYYTFPHYILSLFIFSILKD